MEEVIFETGPQVIVEKLNVWSVLLGAGVATAIYVIGSWFQRDEETISPTPQRTMTPNDTYPRYYYVFYAVKNERGEEIFRHFFKTTDPDAQDIMQVANHKTKECNGHSYDITGISPIYPPK